MITLDSSPVQGTAQRLLVVRELDSKVARVPFIFCHNQPTLITYLITCLEKEGRGFTNA